MTSLGLRYRPFERLALTAQSRATEQRPRNNSATTRPVTGRHTVLAVTEDLPGIWVENMLFNMGTRVRVTSNADALRRMDAISPPASPHPYRFPAFRRPRRSR
jgi:hypothetical protein